MTDEQIANQLLDELLRYCRRLLTEERLAEKMPEHREDQSQRAAALSIVGKAFDLVRGNAGADGVYRIEEAIGRLCESVNNVAATIARPAVPQ